MKVRRVLAVAAVAAVAVTPVVARAVIGRDSNEHSSLSQNAKRFLELSGADRSADGFSSAPSSDGVAEAKAPAPASSGRPDCGTSPTTPAGWCLTPAGSQFDVLRFPIGLTVDPASGNALVSSDSGGAQAIAVVDPTKPAPAAVTFAPAANLFLGLSVSSSGRVYASGGNADRVFRYQLAGPVAAPLDATDAAEIPTHNATNALQARANGGAVQAAPVGDGIHVGGYPGESVLDEQHHLLFVGGTLSEPSGKDSEACGGTMPDGSAVPACARVSVIDTTKENTGTDPVVRRVAVGADTYGLALDAAHQKLFVANWGDQASRGNGQGTVSVLSLDPATGVPDRETAVIPVGHHPESVALTPNSAYLYVTDTNDDTVTIIDTQHDKTVGVLDVGVPGHAVGTLPDALAVAPDGSTLFVALAGLNAVQTFRLNDHGLAVARGDVAYIPTGWYPSALAAVATPDGGTRLWVANAKGVGFGPGGNGSVLFEGTTTGGTVSSVDLPADRGDAQYEKWTAQVVGNDGLDENPDPCAAALSPSPVLCPNGRAPSADNPSPIKHVVEIVVENKTFDSYFGDIGAGYDANPAFLLFGQPSTTNQHKLVTDGVAALGDNFYSDAEVSVTGHSFTSGAIATDHNEKTWPGDYDQGIRGTHGNGDPLRPSVGNDQQAAAIGNVEGALYNPEGGFVFERFKEAGAVDPLTKEQDPQAHPLSIAIYGEHSTATVGPEYHAKWTRTADQGGNVDWKAGDIQYFDSCRARLFISGKVDGGNTPDTDFTRDCENRQLDPQFTLADWTARYPTQGDVMPNYIYMSLPDNHTLGTNLGSPTPNSMVADNDNAIGQIIGALSKSPFWSSTAVIIVQDDTQATGDHVSPLRDTLEVASPYAAIVPDHQRASMGSVLRTAEMLFGVGAVGINDTLAAPLHGAFVSDMSDAHMTPYDAVTPLVPFALNEPGAPGQADSMAMDWSQVDRIDMGVLNAIWRATQRGIPYEKPAAPTVRRSDDD